MSDKTSIIPFKSKGAKQDATDGTVLDHGTIGGLEYEVYQRGCIHIFDKARKYIFKKDCDTFEDEVANLDLDKMHEGDAKVIKGSGDNDSLVFTCTNGDVELKLESRSYPMVEKLRNILRGGKKKKIIASA